MFVKVLAVIGFVAVASAADLSVGHGGGKLIFEQNVTASPAIWKQVKTLTVNATNTTDEVISQVVVVDNRPEKDGEATVIEGGEGQKNVTLELKSPAVFRGMDFYVQVFATENVNARLPNHPKATGEDTQNPQVPKDLNVNENQEPKNGDDIILEAPKPTASSTTEANKDDQQKLNPALVGNEQTRLNRDTQEQKPKDLKPVQTPVEVDATKDIKVNENANKTAADIDENLKKTFDTIFVNNSTQNNEDTQKAVPVMPQAESDDLSILRDEEENRKARQATKEPAVPVLPKELTHDDHTTPKSNVSSTTEKNVEQKKTVLIPATTDSIANSSTTSSDQLKTTLPENVNTTQELQRNVKGHHLGHHHAVPLPYVN